MERGCRLRSGTRRSQGVQVEFHRAGAGRIVPGSYNQPGNIPSGTLSGQIQPTGNAHLTMDGLTGDPDYSLSRVHAGTPIHYTATAQFTARSGTGTRDQARHCDLAFSKI